MRFDIDGQIDGKTYREIVRAAADSLLRRSRAKRAAKELPAPRRNGGKRSANLPLFTEDNLPDFQVAVIVHDLRGRRFTAELRWLVRNKQGSFPVIPESALGPDWPRTSSMKPYQFASELAAVAEGARQCQALTDSFVIWAMEGVEDV